MGGWRRWLVVLAIAGLAACERVPSSESEPSPRVVTTSPSAADTNRTIEPPIEREAPKPAAKPKKRRKLSSRVESPATELDAATSDLNAAAPTLGDFDAEPRSCCKYCSKGKACGNSCIAASKTCHKGVGCACDR
jgi:hypothetical protein